MRKLVLFFVALVVVGLLLVLKTKSASALCQCNRWKPYTERCCPLTRKNGKIVKICGQCSEYECKEQHCTGTACGPGYYTCNRGCCPIGGVGGCTGCGCWCACGFDDTGGETGHDCGKSCCAQCYVRPYPNSCMCAHSNYNADKTCPWGQRLSDEWVDAGWCLDRQHSRFHPRARRAFCW